MTIPTNLYKWDLLLVLEIHATFNFEDIMLHQEPIPLVVPKYFLTLEFEAKPILEDLFMLKLKEPMLLSCSLDKVNRT